MSDAITESRGIFSNIRKAIRYLIACNLGEVLTLLFRHCDLASCAAVGHAYFVDKYDNLGNSRHFRGRRNA